MQLKLSQADAACLQVTAPIGPNSNHHKTAFGGSIATVGIACGWAWTHLRIQKARVRAKLVIQKNCVEYLAPVHADFTAECCLQDEGLWQDFLQRLHDTGRARIALDINTRSQGELVARHNAIYAASLE